MTDSVEAAATPRRMAREARRAALLDAAAAVLRRADRPALSFEAVADEAGVSATLPYKYFDSVDEMAGELYRRLVGEVDDATDAILADADLGFEDKLRATLTLWMDTIRADGLLLLRLTEDPAHPSLRGAVEARRERAVQTWATHAEAELELDPTTARLLSGCLLAASIAMLQRWIVDRLDADLVVDVFSRLAEGQIRAVTTG